MRSIYSKQPCMEHLSTCGTGPSPTSAHREAYHSCTMDLAGATGSWKLCARPACSLSLPQSQRAGPRSQGSRDVLRPPACGEDFPPVQQSRAHEFDLPFKRLGIPLLTANLSPQWLLLLHEEVVASWAWRENRYPEVCSTPTFREQRASESKLWPGTGESPRCLLKAPPWHQNYSATPGRRHRRPEAETAPRGLRRTSPGDRDTSLPDGAARGRCQEQPSYPRTPARHCTVKCSPEGATAETPEVRRWSPEGRHAEGRQAWNSTLNRGSSEELLSSAAPQLRMRLRPGRQGGGAPGGPGVPVPGDPLSPDLHHHLGLELLAGGCHVQRTACCVFNLITSIIKPPHSRVLFHFHNVRIWGREYFVIFVWIRTERLYCIMYYLS